MPEDPFHPPQQQDAPLNGRNPGPQSIGGAVIAGLFFGGLIMTATCFGASNVVFNLSDGATPDNGEELFAEIMSGSLLIGILSAVVIGIWIQLRSKHGNHPDSPTPSEQDQQRDQHSPSK